MLHFRTLRIFLSCHSSYDVFSCLVFFFLSCVSPLSGAATQCGPRAEWFYSVRSDVLRILVAMHTHFVRRFYLRRTFLAFLLTLLHFRTYVTYFLVLSCRSLGGTPTQCGEWTEWAVFFLRNKTRPASFFESKFCFWQFYFSESHIFAENSAIDWLIDCRQRPGRQPACAATIFWFPPPDKWQCSHRTRISRKL